LTVNVFKSIFQAYFINYQKGGNNYGAKEKDHLFERIFANSLFTLMLQKKNTNGPPPPIPPPSEGEGKGEGGLHLR
jgi:hypothetical protein